MDFLLECVGFPPDHDFDELARVARRDGEPVAWRGPAGDHLRMKLGNGLEVRMDREAGARAWTLYPHFQSSHRLRLAVEDVADVPDSPFDAIVFGFANPPIGAHGAAIAREAADSYPLAAIVTDARRLPRKIERGRVLALSLAGFALDVDYVGPTDASREPRVQGVAPPAKRFADGSWIQPLGGIDAPGGCVELSLEVRSLRRLSNPFTGAEVTSIEVSLPSRPLTLFASPWQLEVDGVAAPRVGWRVEGTFLLTGRLAGGLASPTERLGSTFG